MSVAEQRTKQAGLSGAMPDVKPDGYKTHIYFDILI